LGLFAIKTSSAAIACQIFSRELSMTNKFARRFVIVASVIIRIAHRYVGTKALTQRDAFCLAAKRLNKGDLQCERQS
jgi:hypothetical protein